MKSFNKVGLVINTKKEKSFDIARKVLNWLKEKNWQVFLEAAAVDRVDAQLPGYSFQELREKVDLVILFGGDGTFLYTAHHFLGTDIPLIGFNLGKMGFLTEIEIDELEKSLQMLEEGNFKLEQRMFLKAVVERKGRAVFSGYALNDAVINRGANARMIGIELNINNQPVNSYRADGLIAATPTGSTAYSLSAGGPIVNPDIKALLITPICPHTLYVRPLIISEKESIAVVVTGDNKQMKITIDGRKSFSLHTDDKIIIEAASENINIIKFPGKTFYKILHQKMRSGLV